MSLDYLYFAFVSPSPSIPVMIVDGTPIPLVSIGSIITPHLSLCNVYLIPKLTLNPAFIGHLYDFSDYLVIFSSLYFIMYRICSLRS